MHQPLLFRYSALRGGKKAGAELATGIVPTVGDNVDNPRVNPELNTEILLADPVFDGNARATFCWLMRQQPTGKTPIYHSTHARLMLMFLLVDPTSRW